MVKVKNDLTGKIFGRLKVLYQADDHVQPNGTHIPMWMCECSCEKHTIKVISGYALTNKRKPTRSCGCMNREHIYNALHKTNKYDLSGEYGIGWTSNTNKEFYFDIEDYDKIKDYCWNEKKDDASNYINIVTKINNKNVTMHSLLGFRYCDHKNRNALDNRKHNLRSADLKENARNRNKQRNNTSGFTGVYWDKHVQKWRAKIKVDGKSKSLGYFSDIQNAIVARLKAELEYFGKDFAPQRHLFKDYGIEE